MEETNKRPVTDSARRKDRMNYTTAFSLNGKTPPQSIELEQAVLGALMLDQNALSTCIESLFRDYFYKIEHQMIFDVVRTLFTDGKQVDILTVVEELQHRGQLETVGGAYYVTSLTNHVTSAAHIEYHIRILSEKFIQRELIRVSTDTITKAYDETTDVLSLLDDTEQELLKISDKNFHSDYQDMETVVHSAFDLIKETQSKDGSLSGIPTGMNALDKETAGFQPGTLIILAARPAMGKTALALSMARNMAMDFQIPIAFFSLEMTAVELCMRLISGEAEIAGERLKKGEKLEPSEQERLLQQGALLSKAPIFIDETPNLSVFELRAKCRRLKKSHDIKMVFIDYLQLMQGNSDGNKSGNREQEISYISRQLKALSKELQVPVLALSQLSRAVETRGGSKRPVLSDLRESGAIEQDADIVMFIYRPEYYEIFEDEKGSTIGMADVILAKHRSGSTGDVRLRFIKQFAKFANPEVSSSMGGDTFSQMPPNASFDQATNTMVVDSKMNNDISDFSFGNNMGGSFDNPTDEVPF